ncbi:MAG: F0F1 ATP synthase subunit delta [Patescibacteria group bacterium]
MKYSPILYAKAFSAVLAKEKPQSEKVVLSNMVLLVKKNGDEAHWDAILKETSRLLRKAFGIHHILLESARPLTKEQRASLEKSLPTPRVIEEKISSELVAGVRITIDGMEQFDGSLFKKLETMLPRR